jgi:hypothetical protein
MFDGIYVYDAIVKLSIITVMKCTLQYPSESGLRPHIGPISSIRK